MSLQNVQDSQHTFTAPWRHDLRALGQIDGLILRAFALSATRRSKALQSSPQLFPQAQSAGLPIELLFAHASVMAVEYVRPVGALVNRMRPSL